MKKSLFFWQVLGFIFVGVAGVILHFLFDWVNQSIIVAPFSAINESVWEHMKLLFFPMFLFAIIESRYIGDAYRSFWCVKLAGTLIGVGLIPVLFYTINGVFGLAPDFVNILIFYVAAAVGFLAETRMFKNDNINCISPKTAIELFVILSVVFVMFTFSPPQLPIFEDPITNTFGYYKKM